VLRAVPRVIAAGVAERQMALLTNDALSDSRTSGETVIQQAVRSAMAAPLLGEGSVTLGVLYVDNMHDTHAFADADLDYLIAYAGLAAVTAEREVTALALHKALQVRENFERYFTPQLAERIAHETGTIAPGGERRQVVVLFSDIRGFTALAETLPPMVMAAQLNEYFEAMVDCVFRHEGALDKFIGDALMAYWGAPDAFADDADRAIASALDMQRELARLNARWTAEGRSTLDIGIGVHRGEAFVGNIGSPRRLEYTLIGDTVNVASRLCAHAGKGQVLVSSDLRAALLVAMPTRPRPDVVPERRLGTTIDVWSVDVPS
jgi:adenylate cyclase